MPKTKKCPQCQTPLAATRRQCPKCGHVFGDAPKRPKTSRPAKAPDKDTPQASFLTGLIIVALAILFFVGLTSFNVKRERRARIASYTPTPAPTAAPTERPNDPDAPTAPRLSQGKAMGLIRIHLRDLAYIPESVDVQEWGDYTRDADGTYFLPCRWTWQSQAGVTVTERRVFHLSSGGAILDSMAW